MAISGGELDSIVPKFPGTTSKVGLQIVLGALLVHSQGLALELYMSVFSQGKEFSSRKTQISFITLNILTSTSPFYNLQVASVATAETHRSKRLP
jgi:hypothetical protein